MRKPPFRTVVVVLSLALMGGLALWLSRGNFADYASLLKYLGWAAAVKSSWEHTVSKPSPPEAPK